MVLTRTLVEALAAGEDLPNLVKCEYWFHRHSKLRFQDIETAGKLTWQNYLELNKSYMKQNV